MLPLLSYFSFSYLGLILPVTVLLYALVPKKLRRVVLLAAGYWIVVRISGVLVFYLITSTLLMHGAGLWMDAEQEASKKRIAKAPKEDRKVLRKSAQKRRKAIAAFGIAEQLGILLVLKYSGFFAENLNLLLRALKAGSLLPVPHLLLPIGISFYTMQAMSYLFDVYYGKIPADRNVFRLALYLNFFPLLMEGPICRYEQTANQLWEVPDLTWKNFTFGLQRILWGAMKKFLVADRLNTLIKNVFTYPSRYDGFAVAAAVLCYTVQLYMDFSGTIDLACGSAEIFGIRLPENFRQPFFSVSISEFWSRWHITLGLWFREYLFYPLSLTAPLRKLAAKGRKRFGNYYGVLPASAAALLAVWLCNGLWHGAGWQYLFFGLYHFVLILLGNVLDPPLAALRNALHIPEHSRLLRLFRLLRTFLLVCIGELFFRAENLTYGFLMFRKIFTEFSLETLRDGSFFEFGLIRKDLLVASLTLLLVFAVSLCHERKKSVREWLAARPIAVRYALLYLLILTIVIFGAYGRGYVPVDPIYAGF